MKIKIFGLIALLFALSACSPSSSGGGGNGGGTNTQQNASFEKLAVGVWVSECQHSQEEPNYREKVTLEKAGQGKSEIMSFQTTDCSGNSTISGDIVPFTYSVNSTDGKNSKLAITPKGQNAFEITLDVQEKQMTITWPAGAQPAQTVYYRISPPNPEGDVVVKPADPHQSPTTEDAKNFDLLAKGRWTSKTCSAHQNGQSSYELNPIFYGQGLGEFEILSYANANCTGAPQRSTQRFEYRVDHFANKAGQITLNGEIMDVMFDVAEMKVFTANGNTVFQKAD